MRDYFKKLFTVLFFVFLMSCYVLMDSPKTKESKPYEPKIDTLDVASVVAVTAGVVNREGMSSVKVRGGRSKETAYILDGIAKIDEYGRVIDIDRKKSSIKDDYDPDTVQVEAHKIIITGASSKSRSAVSKETRWIMELLRQLKTDNIDQNTKDSLQFKIDSLRRISNDVD